MLDMFVVCQLQVLAEQPGLEERHPEKMETHANDRILTAEEQQQQQLHDIDKFMEGCKRSPYTEGWSADEWREEIEKHPFFMTKEPQLGEELHPLLEGLQQLKFDEKNTPEELASAYKEDGIHRFKLGKYRDAIANFTAGLKYDCSKKMRAELLNNRAASHFFLKNYRSSLLDSEKACESDPGYQKARMRVARCFYELEKYRECIETCEEILSADGANLKMSQLRKDAFTKKKLYDRDSRKKQKKIEDDQKLLQAIKNRKIKITINGEQLTDVTQLDPPINMPVSLQRVHFCGDVLTWPVVFCFPEYETCLSVQEFREPITFSDNLMEMFESLDSSSYKCDTVSLYFKDEDSKPVKISIHQTLNEVLNHPRYFQDSGIPMFFVLIKNSESEKAFLNSCDEPVQFNFTL